MSLPDAAAVPLPHADPDAAAAASVCSLSVFGLLFGLIDLKHLGPSESA